MTKRICVATQGKMDDFSSLVVGTAGKAEQRLNKPSEGKHWVEGHEYDFANRRAEITTKSGDVLILHLHNDNDYCWVTSLFGDDLTVKIFEEVWKDDGSK